MRGATDLEQAQRYLRRGRGFSQSDDGASTTSSLLMALGEHPVQLRRRRWRIFAIRVRFIFMARRVLRQQAAERTLVPFLEAQGLDEMVVAWLLTWYRQKGI